MSDFKRVKKTGAGGFDVETGARFCAEFALDESGGVREHLVGGYGCDCDKVEFLGGNSGHIERAFGRFVSEVGSGNAFIGDMALLDSGAGRDPFVGSLHHFFQIGVCQNTIGDIHSRTFNHNSHGSEDSLKFSRVRIRNV